MQIINKAEGNSCVSRSSRDELNLEHRCFEATADKKGAENGVLMREDKATKVQWRHSAKMGVCEGDCGRSHKKDYLKFPWKTSCCFSTAWLNFSLSSVILNQWNLLLLERRLSLGSNLDSTSLPYLKEKELWAGSWWSSGFHVWNMFRGRRCWHLLHQSVEYVG